MFCAGLLLFTAFAALGNCQIPTQPVELQSYNAPDHYIGLNGNAAYIRRLVNPQRWVITKGLCGIPDTISFQSVYDSNKYLRHQSFLFYEHPFIDTDLYRNDACFYMHKNKWFPGHDAFESVIYRGRYIRHQYNRLKLHQYESIALFEMDASFRIVKPVCLTFKSQNYPTHSFGLNGEAAYIKTNSEDRWILISPGLTGHAQTVSFRSCSDATKYLRHQSYVLWEHPYSSSLNKWDATFTVRTDKWFDGYDAYESVNFPGYFLRHQGFRLRIHNYDGAQIFKKDASFHIYE